MAGEAAFVAARASAVAHSDRYAAYLSGKAQVDDKAAQVRQRVAALQEHRSQLSNKLYAGYHILDTMERSRQLPSPPTYLDVAAIAVRLSRGWVPPVGWRPGMPLDGSPVAAQEPPSSSAAASGAGTAMEVEVTAPIPAATVAEPVVLELQPPPRISAPPSPAQPPQATGTLPPSIPAASAAAAAPAPSTTVASATSAAEAAGSRLVPPSIAAAAGPTSASGLMSMLASLPPAARQQLLKLFPPGWRPGDPLPTNLPDPRTILAQLAGKLPGRPAATGAPG